MHCKLFCNHLRLKLTIIRYNGLVVVLVPERDNFQLVVSDKFFDPGEAFDLAPLTMNMALFATSSNPPLNQPPAETYPDVPTLQTSLQRLREGNSSSQWNVSNLIDCYNLYANAQESRKPNIVFVVNWTNPDSNNTALDIAYLGYAGVDLLALCPTSFYNTTPSGVQVQKDLCTLTMSQIIGDTNLDWKCCQICFLDTKFPQYQPHTTVQVTDCLNEAVEASFYRFAYSAALLKMIIGFLVVKAVGLTLTVLCLRESPMLVLGDAIAEYLRTPDPSTFGMSALGI